MRRCGITFFLIFLVTPAFADDAAIGFVKTLSGPAILTREAVSKPVELAMAVHVHDRLETMADARVGITFRDNTRISIGPNSRVDLPSFVFRPASREYGFMLRLAYGTMEYLSGLTAKLAPDAMSIETPTATIAVRGTRFLVRAEK